ncbi:hypothetical protein [Rheinheimera sp. NSM]|uniref:hypothetical protein n=1 Tax=Rheinheimera sp. NSM TaxID=3457884 RepID=UPI00403721BD
MFAKAFSRFLRLLVIFSIASFSLNAATFNHQGAVRDILLRTTMEPYAVFYVEGFTAAGDCRTYDGHVIVSLDNNEKGKAIYSLLLTAFMAGKDVKIGLVDTDKDIDGNCRVREVRFR